MPGIYTVDSVPAGFCKYASMKGISNYADIILTHWEFLKHNSTFFETDGKPGLLVIDEADEFLRPHDIVLVKYKGYPTMHIERSEDHLEDLYFIFQRLRANSSEDNRLQRAFERIEYFRTWLNPPNLEAMSIEAARERYDQFPLDPDKQKELDKYGCKVAFGQVKVVIEPWNHPDHIESLRAVFRALNYRDFSALNEDDRKKLMYFYEIACDAKKFDLKNRRGSEENPSGYSLLVLSSRISDFTNSFGQVIFISATPPINFPESIRRIDLSDRQHYPKNLFLHFNYERGQQGLTSLIRELEGQNVLGITTSKKRAEELLKHFPDAKVLQEDPNVQGLAINYYGSKFSRGVNSLSNFDAVLVFDWISDAELAIANDAKMLKQRAENNCYQLLGRALRAEKDGSYRQKVVIFLHQEPFERMMDKYSGSNFVVSSSLEDCSKRINEWVEKPKKRSKLLENLQLKLVTRRHKGRDGKIREYRRYETLIPPDFKEKLPEKANVVLDLESGQLLPE
jgi:hypothetical protein